MPARSKARLSIVMLSKNDELFIQRTLDPLAGWADEIVVIDDGSTDRTVEICRNAGANVIIRPMTSDGFAGQKNLGIDSTTGAWVLQLDSDEVVTEKLKSEITRVINDPGDKVAFSFIWEEYFLNVPMSSVTQEIHIRLFKKGRARFNRSIHERLEVDGPAGAIDAKVAHYPYNSISRFVQKNNFYTTAEANYILESRGVLSDKEIRQNLTWNPLKQFWKLYVRKKGCKDGMHGLVWCLLHVIRRILIWAKYWELVNAGKQDKGGRS